MNQPTDWLPKRIYYLASGLYYGAVFLRTLIIYRGNPVLVQALGLLLLGLALFLSEPALSRRWPRYFPLYMLFQVTLVFLLLSRPGFSDFYGNLMPILSMQVMSRLNPKLGALWISLCAPIIILLLVGTYGTAQAIALGLVYTAGNFFFGTYALAMRRAQSARQHNQSLARDLQEANYQLEAYSAQLGQLAVAQERNRLARELHDSVTQTVFSMTLTTQSALLLLERQSDQVGTHLERLNQLGRSALAEMQVLISELKPDKAADAGLVPILRRHLAGGRLPENLAVTLDVEGEQSLQPLEEKNLFHIAEEALNNVMKHAHASQAMIRLHLADPFWMEIEDHGQGFDLQQAQDSGQVGLSSMRERATEIGWELHISTSPGAGTRIRVEKPLVEKEQE